MAGRKRLPDHLRLLEGNRSKVGIPASVREEVAEKLRNPKAKTANPGKPPEWLTEGARKTWERLVGIRGLLWLDSIDHEVFAAFCSAYARMVDAERKIQTEGMTYVTVNGGVGMRPEVRVANQCALLVRSIGSELGLTPAARARLGTVPEKPDSAGDVPPELRDAPANGTGA